MCVYVCMHVCVYLCMYVCMYVCMHVCMYVCVYVCLHVHTTHVCSSELDHFLESHSRTRHSVIGDGNCLFRSISYLLFETQDEHPQVRKVLTNFINLNRKYFKQECDSSVKKHTKNMIKEGVWGTNAEIRALSLYFNKPVFVALERYSSYCWASMTYTQEDKKLSFPQEEKLSITTGINHFEIYCVNNYHYDALVCTDGSLPRTLPELSN